MERRCPYLYTGSKFRVIWPSVLIIQRGVATTPLRKICLGKTLRRTRVKGILYDFEKKMKNFIFQFFDENLLSAWFKDERPQGLSWQSALKGYYTILWQKYKNRIFHFLFLVKMVLVLFKGTRTENLIWKNPLKGYCMILKKNEKSYFLIFWWKSVVGVI